MCALISGCRCLTFAMYLYGCQDGTFGERFGSFGDPITPFWGGKQTFKVLHNCQCPRLSLCLLLLFVEKFMEVQCLEELDLKRGISALPFYPDLACLHSAGHGDSLRSRIYPKPEHRVSDEYSLKSMYTTSLLPPLLPQVTATRQDRLRKQNTGIQPFWQSTHIGMFRCNQSIRIS
jgi:hypothetical protein